MTQAGKRVYHFAKSIEQERGYLLHDLDQLRDEVVGDLAIVASTIPGEFIVPPLLGEFKALHPAVRASVAVSDSYGVIAKVRDGEYEVGFCGLAPEGLGPDSFKVAEDEIVLIVFPDHPFTQREEVSLLELEGEPLIFREETSGTQRSLQSLLLEAGFDLRRCPSSLVLGTTQAIVSAVEAKVGISFVSNLAIKKSLALGLIKMVRVDGLKLRRSFYCIYRRERVVSRLFAEFIAFIEAQRLD
jgi:DNA-binding transcriptional LysR family regulator